MSAQIAYFENFDEYEMFKENHANSKITKVRPTWDEYFLNIAKQTAERSPDAQTQCGCVITQNNHIVGTGYNGYPSNIDDSKLSNTRPLKYAFFIHSELNAIFNGSLKPGDTVPKTAYITGLPCFPCLISLWQVGVRRIVCGEQASSLRDDDKEYKNLVRLFHECSNDQLKIEIIKNKD